MKKAFLALTVLAACSASGQIKISPAAAPDNTMVYGAQFQINGNATGQRPAPDTFVYNTGKVGIGTTAPLVELDILGSRTDNTAIGLSNSSTNGHSYYLNSLGSANGSMAGSFTIWDGTAGKPRFMIDPTGRAGFGTNQPSSDLDIVSPRTDNTSLGLINATSNYKWFLNCLGSATGTAPYTVVPGTFLIWDGNAAADRLAILPNGNVGLGTLNPTCRLDVAGEIQATAIKGPSDIRFKKDLVPVKDALSKITALKAYNYQWRRSEFPEKNFKAGNDIGLIAQEVEKVVPEVVYTAEDAMKSKSIDYARLVPLLVESIKTLQQEVEALKAEVNKLKK